MHLDWTHDERLAWRVTAAYRLLAARHGRIGALDLERQLVATGKVRAPRVLAANDQVVITCTLKACDDLQARADALSIIDSAARHVDGLAMGEPTIVPAATPLQPTGGRRII